MPPDQPQPTITSQLKKFSQHLNLKRCIIGLLCGLASLLLSACAAGEAQQTLAANHASAGTQVADLRITTTVQGARLRTTLDYVQTEVGFAATQSQFLKSTLVARGTDQAYLDAFQRQMIGDVALALPTSVPTRITPGSAEQLAATAARLATPTPDRALPQIRNPVTALSVGEDDCAVGATEEFQRSDERIYVVARGYNIGTGTRFASRWFYRGTEFVYLEFSSETAFTNECVWFFIDKTDTVFFPGRWTVVWEVDGRQQLDTTNFTIVDG